MKSKKRTTDFHARYGEWAIIAGASEGLGAAYAGELARRGLNLIPVARRSDLLASLAADLQREHGVEVRPIALDLSVENAPERLMESTADLMVGLLVYNAATSAIGAFLERPIQDHLREIDTNVRAPLKLAHLFGGQMGARGRGGIILMASLSAFQGSAYISTYAASKAFNIVLAEGLWEEWRGRGVDVLVCVAGAVRAQNYAASEPQRTGRFSDSTMEPEAVVAEALKAVGRQPLVIPGRMNRVASFIMRRILPRRLAVQFMGRILRDMYVK